MRRAWLIATTTPHITILGFLAYYGARQLVSGTAAAPAEVQDSAPQWLVWVWVVSLIAGAIVATTGLLTERVRVESVGLAWLLFGLGFFMLDDSARVVPILLAGMCLIRLNGLHRARRGPVLNGHLSRGVS